MSDYSFADAAADGEDDPQFAGWSSPGTDGFAGGAVGLFDDPSAPTWNASGGYNGAQGLGAAAKVVPQAAPLDGPAIAARLAATAPSVSAAASGVPGVSKVVPIVPQKGDGVSAAGIGASLVGAGALAAQQAATAGPLTDDGVSWLQRAEGNSVTMTPTIARLRGIGQFDDASKTYVDSTGHLTFGYGHVITPDDGLTVDGLSRMTPSQQQDLAGRLFASDVQDSYGRVVDALGQDTVDQLSPNQRDALIGTVFNGGGNSALGPNMQRAIRAGDFGAAGNQFNAWFGGHPQAVVPGLVRRNLEEQAIWNNRDYGDVSENDPRVRAVVARGGRQP